GTIAPGQVDDRPVISLDVAATALAMAGLPSDPALDGINLIPYLTGQISEAPPRNLYWRWIAQSAIRRGNWKYLRGGKREYLFDLSQDREEKRNLLGEHPEIARRLRRELTGWSQTLTPPGIETGSMSATWESYFDYYLDGKPAPEIRRAAGAANRGRSILGWVTRNATGTISDGFLKVRPGGQARAGGQARPGGQAKPRRPFIAASKLNVNGPVQASVLFRSRQDGKLGVAWREQGQADFPAAQIAWIDVQASSEAKNYQLTLPSQSTVIHIRLLLPNEGGDVADVELRDKTGRAAHRWRFARHATPKPSK
ncbi:MAG: hypothetical protein MI861_00415, partial [Pirellulales bacterium]|nr:hypothetical protein [Pirellulales bacterium]